jgi:hypothetical protein
MRFRRCLPHSVLIGCIGGFDRWRSTVGNEDINKLMTRHTWDPMVQKWFDHEEATTLLDLSGLPPPEFPGIVKTLVVRTKKA